MQRFKDGGIHLKIKKIKKYGKLKQEKVNLKKIRLNASKTLEMKSSIILPTLRGMELKFNVYKIFFSAIMWSIMTAIYILYKHGFVVYLKTYNKENFNSDTKELKIEIGIC